MRKKTLALLTPLARSKFQSDIVLGQVHIRYPVVVMPSRDDDWFPMGQKAEKGNDFMHLNKFDYVRPGRGGPSPPKVVGSTGRLRLYVCSATLIESIMTTPSSSSCE
jgi:hypothetical protein